MRVEGKLVLNRTDPEDFLYTLRDVKVRAANSIGFTAEGAEGAEKTDREEE